MSFSPERADSSSTDDRCNPTPCECLARRRTPRGPNATHGNECLPLWLLKPRAHHVGSRLGHRLSGRRCVQPRHRGLSALRRPRSHGGHRHDARWLQQPLASPQRPQVGRHVQECRAIPCDVRRCGCGPAPLDGDPQRTVIGRLSRRTAGHHWMERVWSATHPSCCRAHVDLNRRTCACVHESSRVRRGLRRYRPPRLHAAVRFLRHLF